MAWISLSFCAPTIVAAPVSVSMVASDQPAGP